jgi:molybdopterin synthase catalytic subunit
LLRIQRGPIDVEELIEAARGDDDGAVATFLGTVRDRNAGREVLYLEYHAYASMAESELAKIQRETLERYAISRVAIVHRTGRLEVGEISVGIAVGAPHRAPAFDACRFVIDTLKHTVPIWKKEFFAGGEIWIEG